MTSHSPDSLNHILSIQRVRAASAKVAHELVKKSLQTDNRMRPLSATFRQQSGSMSEFVASVLESPTVITKSTRPTSGFSTMTRNSRPNTAFSAANKFNQTASRPTTAKSRPETAKASRPPTAKSRPETAKKNTESNDKRSFVVSHMICQLEKSKQYMAPIIMKHSLGKVNMDHVKMTNAEKSQEQKDSEYIQKLINSMSRKSATKRPTTAQDTSLRGTQTSFLHIQGISQKRNSDK